MADTRRSDGIRWTRERTALLALVCLIAGIGGGWFMRGTRYPVNAGTAANSSAAVPSTSGISAAPPAPSTDRVQGTADAQAAPLLAHLKVDPNNPQLLTSLGNLYYDTQQYSTAIGFYQRALKVNPSDVSVRTDLGTAYWYLGDADAALVEFDAALSYAPNNPNTLFNRGLIKWQGKKDAAGAVADWQKLLATNPNYEGKEQVRKMLADVAAQHPSK